MHYINNFFLKLSKEKGASWRHSVNLTWLVVPLSLFFSGLFSSFWIWTGLSETDENFNAQYPAACALIGLSVRV